MENNLEIPKPQTISYFVEYTKQLGDFLDDRGIKKIVSDADIVCIKIDDYNDNTFALLMIDFGRWLEVNTNVISN